MFLTEDHARHCEISEKETDDGLGVVHDHRAPDDNVCQIEDLTKEGTQAGPGSDGLLVNEGVKVSVVVHVLRTTEGPPRRTGWDVFGMAKDPVEVKDYKEFPLGLTGSSKGIASYLRRTL